MRTFVALLLASLGFSIVGSGLLTLWRASDGLPHPHLEARIEEAVEPILEEARRVPRYVIEGGDRDKHLKMVVDTVSEFAFDAQRRAFNLSLKVGAIGLFQIAVGTGIVVIACFLPKLYAK